MQMSKWYKMKKHESQSITISKDEKETYLNTLDNYMFALSNHLSSYNFTKEESFVYEYGKKQKWNLDRLPKQDAKNRNLADLVDRVRREFRWFSWVFNSEDPNNNMGYFNEINIFRESGFPWVHDHIDLGIIKKNSDEILKEIPSYDDMAKYYKLLCTEDEYKLNEVLDKVKRLQVDAMKRNFLENLKTSELLDWRMGEISQEPKINKLFSLGAEEAYNIQFINYSIAEGLFQLFDMDLWQDNIHPQVIDSSNPTISSELRQELKSYGGNITSWFMISDIDKKFEGLHPVRASKSTLGPFENRYLTKPLDSFPPLLISTQILNEDPDYSVLRFKKSSAYAPNHKETKDGSLRQDVLRQDWEEEMIVCEPKYAKRLSESILGSNITIIESNK
jgi:hypothetical protein